MLALGRTLLTIAGSAALALGGAVEAASAAVLPDFSSATFVPGAQINNPFFPLIDGRVRTYEAHGLDDEGEPFTESFILTDLVGEGRVLLGVQTSTQVDRSFEDGLLVEETFDYFAQDSQGNVWYFGEDVTNFIYDDEGNLIDTNHESAWLAGENGALPGFIMPEDLILGFNYFQEFAPNDEALDEGTISDLAMRRTVPAGTFTGVARILETTSLDPDAREFKYYAPGVGLIIAEEGIEPTFRNPDLRFNLVSIQFVPEPSTWTMLLLGFGAAGAVLRRNRRLRAAAAS